MTDMTSAETEQVIRRLDLIEERIKALPDKAEIYKATLVIHAMFWGTIVGTLAALRALGIIGV